MQQISETKRSLDATSNAGLEAEMRRRLAGAPEALSRRLSIRATGGILCLDGIADSEEDLDTIEALADSIPGCLAVYSRIVLRVELRGG
jgi:hypothetical protein